MLTELSEITNRTLRHRLDISKITKVINNKVKLVRNGMQWKHKNAEELRKSVVK